MAQQQDDAVNDDELDDAMYKSTSDRLLFLIDVSAYSATGKEDSEQALLCIHDALSVALFIMKGKVIADSTAMVGVLLYGKAFAHDGGADMEIPGVYGLVPLAPISADHIRRVQDIAASPGALAAFLRAAIEPSSSSSSKSYLREALWMCSQRFDEQKRKTLKFQDLHRVWIFTSEANPSGGEGGTQDKILKRAQDCADNGIEVSLWCYERTKGAFDVDTFYSKILGVQVASFGGDIDMSTFIQRCSLEGSSATAAGSNDWGFKVQAVRMRRKESKKRPLCVVPLSFGTFDNRLAHPKTSSKPAPQQQQLQSFINVQVYHLVKVTTKPTAANLDARTNDPVKAVTKLMSSEGLRVDKPVTEAKKHPPPSSTSGTTTTTTTSSSSSSSSSSAMASSVPLKGDSLRQFYDFAGISIPFSKDTLRDLKAQHNTPSISIIFFAERSSVLSKVYHIEAPYFIFPDEKSVQGSSALIACLLKDMIAKDLVACVKFVRSRQSQARLGVLIPQEETLDEGGAQSTPAGFNMICVPFLDDLRSNPAPPIAHTLEDENNEVQVAAAAGMIKRLMYSDSRPSPAEEAVESPSLQLFWAVIESWALGGSQPDWNPSKDMLVPLMPGEELAVLPEVTAFKEATKLLSDEEMSAKYGSSSHGESSVGTKRKAVTSDALVLSIQPYQEYSYEEFVGLTNDQLKGLCRGLGLPVGGKKDDLINRIINKRG